jgi:hypothetical protein
MPIRTIAALANGNLVFALYLFAWGASSWPIVAIEAVLAIGAAWSTWYALRRFMPSRTEIHAHDARSAVSSS